MPRPFAVAVCVAAAAACGSPRPAPPIANAARTAAPAAEYHARQAVSCGHDALWLSNGPREPALALIAPTGGAAPRARLDANVYPYARFVIRGEPTGRTVASDRCGAMAEWRITDFRAWGPVQRVFSPEAVGDAYHQYTQDRPTDRFVNADYVDDVPVILAAERCVELVGRCPAPTRFQTDTLGRGYCCPLR